MDKKEKESSYTVSGNVFVQSLWKTVWSFLKKKTHDIEVQYDLATPFLGIYQEKMKTLVQKDMCTPMFIAALFTVAKIYKQP